MAPEVEVEASETLARFLLHPKDIRSDNTVKPDRFIPYKRVELSVTRHAGYSEEQVWQAGQEVSGSREMPLFGRADFQAETAHKASLRVLARPLANNENHADVVDWPADKPSQKERALVLAIHSRFVAAPII